LWYCTSVVYIMSESSYNLRPRIKVRSRSATRSALSYEPSSVTRSAVTRSILTGEKGPVPGQHAVPEVVGSVVAPSPGPEMWSRQVFSIYSKFHRNWFRGFEAPRGPNLPFPITFATVQAVIVAYLDS